MIAKIHHIIAKKVKIICIDITPSQQIMVFLKLLGGKISVPTTKGGWLGSCNLDCVGKMPSLLSLVNPQLNLGFEADSWIHYCHKKI